MSDKGKEIDQVKLNEFFGKVWGDLKSIALGMNYYHGDKLGLFKTLDGSGPITERELAKRTGLQTRYVREWLGSMVCGGVVEFDPVAKTFSMPPERGMVLSNEDSPVFLSGFFEMMPTWYANSAQVAEHFRSGGGVAQTEFREEFWRGFERFTRAQFVNHIAQHWMPAMPDVAMRLEGGGSVADVGCGNGQAALLFARTYPKAKVVGYDNYPLAIEQATERARRAGVADRVRFQVADVTKGLPEKYDLITTFDVVHDMVDPVGALRGIHKSLAPKGAYLWHEFNVSSDLEENRKNALGLPVLLFSASTNYCMTTSLSQGGAGYGAVLGEHNAREIAKQAGFGGFERLPIEDPFHALYRLGA
jgi:SAM-dependent methyltransferase